MSDVAPYLLLLVGIGAWLGVILFLVKRSKGNENPLVRPAAKRRFVGPSNPFRLSDGTRKTLRGAGQVANAGLQLMAVLGVNSKNPEMRRASMTVLAMNTKNEFLAKFDQMNSGSRYAAPGGSVRSPSSIDPDVFLSQMRAVHEAASEPYTEKHNADCVVFAEYLQLPGGGSGAAGFAVGATHLGYASRLAEERQGDFGSPLSVKIALDDAAATGLAPPETQVAVCLAFAEQRLSDHGVLNVMAIPGAFHGQREVIRGASLELLTTPGATFTATPPGISAVHVNQAWDYGYALRCCEVLAFA